MVTCGLVILWLLVHIFMISLMSWFIHAFLKHSLNKADIHLRLTMLSSCCAWRLKPAFKLILGDTREAGKSDFAPDGLPLLSSSGPVLVEQLGTITKQEGNPNDARWTGQGVSSSFPPENYLLERSVWLFASVFFSRVPLKEGELGEVKGDFRTGMLTEELVLLSNSQVLSFLA